MGRTPSRRAAAERSEAGTGGGLRRGEGPKASTMGMFGSSYMLNLSISCYQKNRPKPAAVILISSKSYITPFCEGHQPLGALLGRVRCNPAPSMRGAHRNHQNVSFSPDGRFR